MDKQLELPKTKINVSLKETSGLLGLPFVGENLWLDGFNLGNREIEADSVITYCASEKYLSFAINNPKVKALVLSESLYNSISESIKKQYSFIISETPEWTFYKAYQKCIDKGFYPSYTWETQLGDARLLPGAIVEQGVVLGGNVIIGSNTVIKSGTIIGDNVRIGSCCVIGGEGLQLIKDNEGRNHAIVHEGRTYIGNDVYIGDNVTISKSLFEGYTRVGNSVKVDNHVHIAHNCIVGENSVLTASVTLFGSCSIGKDAWLAPNSSVMNRVKVGDNAFVGASSFVIRNVQSGSKVFGVPAIKID